MCLCVMGVVCGEGRPYIPKRTDDYRDVWFDMCVLVFTDNEAIMLGIHSCLWHK